jgi:hypothetical protein
VTIAVSDFVPSVKVTGAGSAIPNLRVAEYPGAIAVHSIETVKKNIQEVVYPQIVKLLTEPAAKVEADATEPETRDIVFKGTFEEVNEFYYKKQWSDGLPIIPPTIEKVNEFLKYTSRSSDEVLGILQPSMLEASIWSIAVNGVMAGCRPEYMPVLISIIEVITDSRFCLQDAGSSSGWAPMIILNGPVIDELNFGSGTGVLRVGNQANTSVSRFLRLYMRNAAGFIPGAGDMGTYGRANEQVLAENEEASPWEPLSVTRGFNPGDSTVTINSVGFMSFHLVLLGDNPKQMLKNLAANLKQLLLGGDLYTLTMGPEVSPQLVLSPVIANALAKGGYSKLDVQQYLYEHSKVPAREFDYYLSLQAGLYTACSMVKAGKLPKQFCESDDLERLVPLYHSPEELLIIVAGTRERNRFFITQNNGRQGLATTKKIELNLLNP